MTKRPWVWAVSSGSYSSYRVHAIFATEAAAQSVCDIENGTTSGWGDYAVESFELLDGAERHVDYEIKVDRTPRGAFSEPTSFLEGGFYLWESERLRWEWESPTPRNGRPKATRWRNGGMIVIGRDREAVRKSVYDTIAQVRAQEAGIA